MTMAAINVILPTITQKRLIFMESFVVSVIPAFFAMENDKISIIINGTIASKKTIGFIDALVRSIAIARRIFKIVAKNDSSTIIRLRLFVVVSFFITLLWR